MSDKILNCHHLARGSLVFNVNNNDPTLTRTAIVNTLDEDDLPDDACVIFHHDIEGRPYDDGRWFEKHDAVARILGRHSMEVTITSKFPPDETLSFSWVARPALPCGQSDSSNWPVILSGVLAPECRSLPEIQRTIFSPFLPENAALSFRMLGDASGYASGETLCSDPAAFDGVVASVQTERVDSKAIQVTATMLEGTSWPLEGAIAYIVRAAPTSTEADSFRGVFGCVSIDFENGSTVTKRRIHAGMKLPRDPSLVAAVIDNLDTKVSCDWEDVEAYSFTLVVKRHGDSVNLNPCKVLIDWEVTGHIEWTST